MNNSMIETAYRILSDETEPISFLNLWKQVSTDLGFTQAQADDKIAHFFSDLSLDNRFVSLPGNEWDLKKRQNTQNPKIDLDAISLEDDEEEEPEEE